MGLSRDKNAIHLQYITIPWDYPETTLFSYSTLPVYRTHPETHPNAIHLKYYVIFMELTRRLAYSLIIPNISMELIMMLFAYNTKSFHWTHPQRLNISYYSLIILCVLHGPHTETP